MQEESPIIGTGSARRAWSSGFAAEAIHRHALARTSDSHPPILGARSSIRSSSWSTAVDARERHASKQKQAQAKNRSRLSLAR
ncbi:hypothetical protein NMY22_g16313 [Coprinellus aureogranulatus]|nr:hypothetical protein NMY22_g16313 [Coprinellus aureogranulatus]